ncbi:MAG: ABC transporter ATP-binding protein [Lachnospiraceae bacterium]|nr:ABC transporter ATP-binding protein [Lachnospiraceae bacterium]
MKVLKILIKRNKFWIALAVFTALISNLSQMFFAYFIGELVNKIETRDTITFSFLAVPVILILSNAFTQFFNQFIGRLSAEKMAHTLRVGYAKILLMRSSKENCSVAAAMSVAQNELAQANSYLGNTFFDITGMAFMGIIATVFLLFQNVLLTVILIVPTLLILIYVVYSSRKLSGIVTAAQEEKAHMNKTAYAMIHAFPSVKIFGGEELCKETYNKRLQGWKKHFVKLGRLSSLYNTLSGILSRVPLLILFLAGSFMVIRGDILIGTLIVFLILQKSLTMAIMNLPNWFANFKVFTTNLSRIDIE